MKKLSSFVIAFIAKLLASRHGHQRNPAKPSGNWEFIGESCDNFPYHYLDYINVDSIRPSNNVVRYTMRTVYDPPIQNIDDILVAVDYVEYAIDCQNQTRALVSIKSFNPEGTILLNHAWPPHKWHFRKPTPGSAGVAQNAFVCAQVLSQTKPETRTTPLGNQGHAY